MSGDDDLMVKTGKKESDPVKLAKIREEIKELKRRKDILDAVTPKKRRSTKAIRKSVAKSTDNTSDAINDDSSLDTRSQKIKNPQSRKAKSVKDVHVDDDNNAAAERSSSSSSDYSVSDNNTSLKSKGSKNSVTSTITKGDVISDGTVDTVATSTLATDKTIITTSGSKSTAKKTTTAKRTAKKSTKPNTKKIVTSTTKSKKTTTTPKKPTSAKKKKVATTTITKSKPQSKRNNTKSTTPKLSTTDKKNSAKTVDSAKTGDTVKTAPTTNTKTTTTTSSTKSRKTKKEIPEIELTLEEKLESELTEDEIERFQIEKVNMEQLIRKVCDILAEHDSAGMLQNDLWKKLKLTDMTGSRLALKLERMGTITREKLLERDRWTYKLILKKTPISTQSIEDAPCLTCPVEQKCTIDGEISPRTCQYIEDWVIAITKKSRSK